MSTSFESEHFRTTKRSKDSDDGIKVKNNEDIDLITDRHPL